MQAKGKFPERASIPTIPAGFSVMTNNFFTGPKTSSFPQQRQQALDTNPNKLRMVSGKDSVKMTDE
jgi:hypothetical protein